jgi:hypothetical protein
MTLPATTTEDLEPSLSRVDTTRQQMIYGFGLLIAEHASSIISEPMTPQSVRGSNPSMQDESDEKIALVGSLGFQ